MKNKVVVAEAFTLGDLLGMQNIHGDIEIINECNETLLTLVYIDDNVCPLTKTLSADLLARKILSQGVADNRLFIKVEGVEDAD